MDDLSPVYIIIIETLVFLGILVGCLKLAANRHRAHLRRVIEHANRYGMMREEALATKLNSDELRQKLMAQISSLQARLRLLENIQVKYNDLKAKYRQLQAESGIDEGASGFTIRAGTTLEPGESTHAQNLSSVHASTGRIADGNRSYQKHIRSQQNTIDSLRTTLKNYEADFRISDIKSENKEQALEKLTALEEHLRESENNSNELGASLEDFQNKLAAAQKRIKELEHSRGMEQTNPHTEEDSERSYTIVSRSISDQEEIEGLDLFQAEALANYHRLKKEVEKLRQSTSEQRQVIFSLERDIKKLGEELKGGDLDPEEQFAKELELERLKRLLMETEGCVDILESEVTYLQEKVSTLSKSEIEELTQKIQDNDQGLNDYLLQDKIDQLEAETTLQKQQLERAGLIRGKLRYLISHAGERLSDHTFERVAGSIIDTFVPLNIDAHLRLNTQFGVIDLANSKKIDKQEVASLAIAMESKEQYVMDDEQGCLITFPKVGVYAKDTKEGRSSLGSIEDSLTFILQIANSVITSLEERQSLKNRQAAIRRFMDGLRRSISQMSIQSRYQSDEARNIINSFTDEVVRTMESLDLTETQTKLVGDMVSEVRDRMDILFATDKIIDSDFAKLLDKLDNTAGKN